MIPPLQTRFLLGLVRWRHVLLFAGVVLGIGGALWGSHLGMDRSIERMFSQDDPHLEQYEQLQEAFGEHQIVLASYQEDQLPNASGIARVTELAERVRAVPGVNSVVSVADVPGLLTSDQTAFAKDERGRLLQDVFTGHTHNAQLDAAGVVCLLDSEEQRSVNLGETLKSLRRIISDYPGGVLVGEPVLVEEAFDLLEADGRRLNSWCLGLLLLTILICFRRLRWLVLPLLVVQMALGLTRGLLVVGDLQLSMVSSMLAAIVTVVGVATVMHLIVRYRDQRSRGLTPRRAFLQAGNVLMAPVLFACLTDAVGFAALMTSRVKPVHDFGLMMAIGSLMGLGAIVMLAPGVVLWRGDRQEYGKAHNHHRLQTRLRGLYFWSRRQSLLLSLTLLITTVAALVGTTQLVQETDFTRNFRQDSELVRGYRFVDQQFGGAGVWDILVPAPQQLNQEFLSRVLRFEERLRASAPKLTKVMSLADILDAGTGGLQEMRFGSNLAIRGGVALMRGRMPTLVDSIYNANAAEGKRYFRILLRAPEQLEAKKKASLIRQVRKVAEEEFPHSQVTGYYVLLTRLIESLLRDQWTTFATAAVGIVVVMALAFRSLPLAVATLIPNVLPIVWLFGAMGWGGIRINMGAAMIAAVSLGLSVDGSIHYVMSYRRLRREGNSQEDALEAVQSTVGRAAVFATLALVIGFSTLALSDFVPTIYFGVLVSLSMLGGLIGNLMVLPLLIGMFDR